VLTFMAQRVSGPLLANIVAIDALLVLSGSVLTSFVGVVGLVQRMSGDRCLPELFGTLNSFRGTPHWTILSFFCVCASMCIVMKGEITKLGAVYSLAFLTVMALFAFCGVYMKYKRPTLPREIDTPIPQFILGFMLVSCAFVGVVFLHPEMIKYFAAYYFMTVLCVMVAFMRIPLFMSFLWIVSKSPKAQSVLACFVDEEPRQWIMEQISNLWSLSVIYFTKTSDLAQLNRALRYIEENEEARHVRIVHVYPEGSPMPYHLMECVHVLDCMYQKSRIDCIVLPGAFGPDIIPHITDLTGVSPNCMFINCPKHNFSWPISDFGGVRVILNSEKSGLWDQLKRAERKAKAREKFDSGGLSEYELAACSTSSGYSALRPSMKRSGSSPLA